VASPNVELALRGFKAFQERDIETIESVCTSDVVFDWSRRLLDPVVIKGHEALERFYDDVDAIFDEVSFEIEEVFELGDRVLMVSTGHFRGRTSGIDVSARAALVWTVRDGKLGHFCFYQSKEDALADLEAGEAQPSAARSTSAP
jgi:ketosteroid isomerase-like protein